MPTTCSSKILKGYVPPYNATVIEKLNEAGAVILGKTNMDEFAMGSSNETSCNGNVLNPRDKTRVPGGSSGGSAASVAGDLAFGALGSDTGGSIRQPAALCGIVGLKPTYGVVSRYGLIAFGSSLDQIGPMTKTVEDAAILLNAICGYDRKDSTSQNIDYPDYTKALKGGVKGLKIGVPKEYFGDGLDKNVKDPVKDAIKTFEKGGAEIVDVSLPCTDVGLSVYYIIACAEAASNLARFDGIKYGYRADNYDDLIDLYVKTRSEGFGAEVKRRIMLGNYVLSSGYYDAYYKKALKVRTLIKKDFAEAFEKCDLILGPTSPCTAFKFGEKNEDPLCMYMSDVYTVNINIAGIPAISIPCGKAGTDMPVGLQLSAKPFDESKIFRAAQYFEESEGVWTTI
jgi:aspartyl-tRNA(Asn)/glutamyl-tRNA(Gln) amidotransferase subunit A